MLLRITQYNYLEREEINDDISFEILRYTTAIFPVEYLNLAS